MIGCAGCGKPIEAGHRAIQVERGSIQEFLHDPDKQVHFDNDYGSAVCFHDECFTYRIRVWE